MSFFIQNNFEFVPQHQGRSFILFSAVTLVTHERWKNISPSSYTIIIFGHLITNKWYFPMELKKIVQMTL